MLNRLPAVPLVNFNVSVFLEILRIYGKVTGTQNPGVNKIDVCRETKSVTEELQSGYGYIEHRFGSSLTMHSKIFLHSIKREGVVHIGFDFDPNTSDDSRPRATAMRENFHKKVRKYLNTLPR